MLFNSISYTLKDFFYNLEKLISGQKTTPLELSGPECHPHKIEGSETSGEFLNRVRRGRALKPDHEDTHEIVKEFVRMRVHPYVEETQNTLETIEPAQALTKSITDELPIFGLKASLHASTDHSSFKAWKDVHEMTVEQAQEEHFEPEISPASDKVSDKPEVEARSWRDLSVHTALRLIDHPNTPPDVLMELANHVNAEVRAQVADNPNTPQEAILLLAKDESADVRISLAECYHLGAFVLEMLADDENPYVSDRAQTTLQRLAASENPASISVIRNMFGLEGGKTAEVTPIRARA